MIYEYWLAGIKEITDLKKQKLREVYGSGKAIYYIEETKLDKLRFLNEKDVAILKNAKKDTELEEKWRRTEEKRIQFIPYFLKTYPEKLKYITDPPYALYVLGQLPDEKRKSAAIVGARNCTAYGEQMALQYGKSLAEAGIQIISGMARGIDSMAHLGSIENDGYTYAILGCGVDICYPAQNIELYERITQKGGVISEYIPQTEPLAWHFPSRNRIISALSDSVVMVEAKEKSGSFITVDYALEQGKSVYAVPGRLNDPLSIGCNKLISEGAIPLTSTGQVAADLSGENFMENSSEKKLCLEKEFEMLYSCLGFMPMTACQLAQKSGMEIDRVYEGIMHLQLEGAIEEVAKGQYITKGRI